MIRLSEVLRINKVLAAEVEWSDSTLHDVVKLIYKGEDMITLFDDVLYDEDSNQLVFPTFGKIRMGALHKTLDKMGVKPVEYLAVGELEVRSEYFQILNPK